MKVTYVEVEKMKAELAKPFRVAFGVITSCDTWTVIMHTDEGITGYGSAAPLAFVTGETMETCKIVLDTFAKAFVGQDPTDIEGAHKLMDSIIYANGAAKCAFDLACWDILGKYKNEPVYKLLGAPTNQVVTDYTIGIDAPEAMQKEAHRLVYDKGFDILKVKYIVNVCYQSAGNDIEYRKYFVLYAKWHREAFFDISAVQIIYHCCGYYQCCDVHDTHAFSFVDVFAVDE